MILCNMYYMYFSYIVARTKIELITGSRVKIQLEKIEERLGKAPRICNLIKYLNKAREVII